MCTDEVYAYELCEFISNKTIIIKTDDVKRCAKCKTRSSKSNFYKDITKKDGYRPSCKFCRKKYCFDNQDQILNNNKIYKKNNRSKINAYERLKRKTDFNFKKLCNIRKRTNKAFKSQFIEKTNKTIDLIGCSNSFFKKMEYSSTLW